MGWPNFLLAFALQVGEALKHVLPGRQRELLVFLWKGAGRGVRASAGQPSPRLASRHPSGRPGLQPQWCQRVLQLQKSGCTMAPPPTVLGHIHTTQVGEREIFLGGSPWSSELRQLHVTGNTENRAEGGRGLKSCALESDSLNAHHNAGRE